MSLGRTAGLRRSTFVLSAKPVRVLTLDGGQLEPLRERLAAWIRPASEDGPGVLHMLQLSCVSTWSSHHLERAAVDPCVARTTALPCSRPSITW